VVVFPADFASADAVGVGYVVALSVNDANQAALLPPANSGSSSRSDGRVQIIPFANL